MKKIVLIAVVLVAGFASQAQVKFGIKAGGNLSSWSGDDAESVKSKFGFHAGVLANIPVSSQFSFNPELLLSLEGAKIDDGTDDSKVNMTYLNLPLLAQYNNPSGFYAELGPQIGFLMSAKAKEGDLEEDIKDIFKSTNFSLAFGAGFKTKSGFGFGARYSLGLSNIGDYDEADLKVSNLGFGIFYLFGGAKDSK